MTQEEINNKAQAYAAEYCNAYANSDNHNQLWHSSVLSFKACAALMQPDIERLKELVERYENALKSFGQSLTT